MDWLNGLDKADVRIANVFDVPPEMVGAQKKYENFKEAQRILYEGAVIPTMDLLCSELTNWAAVIGLMPEEFMRLILEKIPALQEDQEAISRRMVSEVTIGIATRNEARTKLGYGKADDIMADILTVSTPTEPLGVSAENLGTEPTP